MNRMRKLFAPNLDTRGRVARAIWGLMLIVAATITLSRSRLVSGLLGAGGLFAFFEAARGWCVMRACGIKTKL
jgi:DUF2892 family protein